MSEEQNRLDELIEERTDLDAEIEAARLLVTDEEIPAPEVVEAVVAEAPTAPATETEIHAAIDKAEAEGRFTETVPLKVRLLELQNGHGGLSQPTAAVPVVLPTLADLNTQIDEAEAAGNYSASSALKSQVLQNRFV